MLTKNANIWKAIPVQKLLALLQQVPPDALIAVSPGEELLVLTAAEEFQGLIHLADETYDQDVFARDLTDLEQGVQERTMDRASATAALQAERAERQRAEAALLQAKEAAEAADRAKSEFLATISHALRTPLNVLLGYTDLLREGQFNDMPKEGDEILWRIHKNATALLALITAILEGAGEAAGPCRM